MAGQHEVEGVFSGCLFVQGVGFDEAFVVLVGPVVGGVEEIFVL